MTTEDLNKIKKTKPYRLLPTLASKDAEWINWMKALDKDYDRSTSVQIFIEHWGKRGSVDARTMQLREFMKDKYKVDLSEGISDKIVDLGGDVMDTVGGVFKTGRVVTIVVGTVILASFVAVVYSLVKNPSNIAYATPQGRALKLLSK